MEDDGYRISERPEAADAVRVLLAGEFDLSNAAELTEALTRAVARAGVARVVVDMRDTTFLDSSGIRAIAIAYEAALDAGKEFRLENLQHSVRRVFEILEMTVLFERP